MRLKSRIKRRRAAVAIARGTASRRTSLSPRTSQGGRVRCEQAHDEHHPSTSLPTYNRRASWRVFIYTCNITGVTTISPVQGSTAGVCVKNECQAASVRVTCNCPEREVELE